MTPPENTLHWAESLFIYQDHTLKQVALKTGYDEALIKQWAEDNEWETKRKLLLTTKRQQLERMYQLLDIITKRVKDAHDKASLKDADLMIKYTTAINKLETETSIGQVIEVAKLYTTWLMGVDLPFCKLVTQSLDEFIKHRLKK